MLKRLLVAGILSLGVGIFAAGAAVGGDEAQPHRRWLQERYAEATSVSAGMTRAELMKLFEADGGVQRIPAGRFVLKSCRMIKVDVEFDVEYGPGYRERPDEELRIKAVSKPYLEPMAAD